MMRALQQLPGEPERAYECFVIFALLPRPNKKLAYQIYTEGRKNSTNFYLWARKFHWDQRRSQFRRMHLQ